MRKSTFFLIFLISFMLLSSIVSAQLKFVPLDILSNFFNQILRILGVTPTATQEKVIPSSGVIVYATDCDSLCKELGYASGVCREVDGETFTFGDTLVEKNTHGERNKIFAYKFVASQTGKVESISIYIHTESGSSCSFRLGIYSDDGGSPGVLLAETNERGIGPSQGEHWENVNLQSDLQVTRGDSYWLAYLGNCDNLKFRYGKGLEDSLAKKVQNYDDGFLKSFGPHETGSSIISIYANCKGACQSGEEGIGQYHCDPGYTCCCKLNLTADNLLMCAMFKNVTLYSYDPAGCPPCRKQKKVFTEAVDAGPCTLGDYFWSTKVIYGYIPSECPGWPCWIWADEETEKVFAGCRNLPKLNNNFECGLRQVPEWYYEECNDFS